MKTHLPPDKKRRKLDEGLSNKITIGQFTLKQNLYKVCIKKFKTNYLNMLVMYLTLN